MPISSLSTGSKTIQSPHFYNSAYAKQGLTKNSSPNLGGALPDMGTGSRPTSIGQIQQNVPTRRPDTDTGGSALSQTPFSQLSQQLATSPKSVPTPGPFSDLASQIANPPAQTAPVKPMNTDLGSMRPDLDQVSSGLRQAPLPASTSAPIQTAPAALVNSDLGQTSSLQMPGPFSDLASQMANPSAINAPVQTTPITPLNPGLGQMPLSSMSNAGGSSQTPQTPPLESVSSPLTGVPITPVDPSLTQLPLQGNTGNSGSSIPPINNKPPSGAVATVVPAGYQEVVNAGAPGLAPSAVLNPVSDVTGENPYSEKVASQFGNIADTIAEQKAHANSLIEQEKQKSINDLSGVLGRMGTGTSYATMLSGLGGIESASAAQKAEQNVALDKQQVEQQLALANAMISAGDVEGGQALKAQIANQATDLQQNAQALDAADQQFAQSQAVQNQIMTNIQNIQTALGDTSMSDEDRKEFNNALQAMSAAQATGQYTPEQLLQLYFSLFGQWSELAGVGYTP